MTIAARPQYTDAVVVGIEKYAAGSRWNLTGPALDAMTFIAWLLDREVPPERIFAFVSPLEQAGANADYARLDADVRRRGVAVQEAHGDPIRKVFAETLPARSGDLLIVFWGGHGVVTEVSDRRLFYANATLADKRHLVFDSLLKTWKTQSYGRFTSQVAIVDACANSFEEMRAASDIRGDEIPLGAPMRGRTQFVMYAASAGQVAKNDTLRNTGEFSSAVLRNLGDTFPPDFAAINTAVKRHFEALRVEGRSRQTPVHYSWDDSDLGGGRNSIGALPVSGATQAAARRWHLSTSQVAALAGALARCLSMQDRSKRDRLVNELPPETCAAIDVRHGDPVRDLQAILTASLADAQAVAALFDVLTRVEDDRYAVQAARERAERMMLVGEAWWALRRVRLAPTRLRALFLASASEVQLAPDASDLEEQLEALASMAPKSGLVPPLVEFMERIACEAPDAALDAWLSVPARADAREGARRRLAAERELQGRPIPYLSVMIRTERLKPGEAQEIEGWLWTGDASRDSHWLEACDGSHDATRLTVCRMLSDAQAVAGPDLVVEFLVPREQLLIAPEHWEMPADEYTDAAALGHQHPVIMRWRERVREPAQARRGAWEGRMRVMLTRAKAGLLPTIMWVSPQTHDRRRLVDAMTRLECADCVGMLFVPPKTPADLKADLLVAALVGGSPVICWLHEAPPDWAAATREVAALVSAGAIETLPHRVRQLRVDGVSPLSRSMSLVCDDPTHLPHPVTARLPGQRGA